MSEKKTTLENRIDALTQKLNSPEQSSRNINYNNNRQNWRGNFRGSSYQNRGNSCNRGNQGYSKNQYNGSNNQNRGRYGSNFNRGNYRGGNKFRGNNRGNFSNYYINGKNDCFQDEGGTLIMKLQLL